MANLTSNESDIKLWTDFLERSLKSEPLLVNIVTAVMLILVFMVSTIGNVVTCVVIYNDKSLHTATNYYLINLAVSDLIATSAVLLEVMEYFNTHHSWGNRACQIHYFFVVALWNNSILVMTILAIERYIAIYHPMWLNSSQAWTRVTKMIVLIWLVAVAETLPEIWTVSLVKTEDTSLCVTVPTPFARILNGVLALVTFIVPLCVMVFVYGMIAIKVNHQAPAGSNNTVFNQRNNRSKVNKLIVALTVSFLVCWLPFFTMRVLYFVYDIHQLISFEEWLSIGYKVISVNSWFSTVLNPILFSLMSTKFRRALKKLWYSKIRRMPVNTHSKIVTNHKLEHAF